MGTSVIKIYMYCETYVQAALPFKKYYLFFTLRRQGWSGGAMVVGKLPVSRRTNLDKSRARAYCACGRCGWGLLGPFSPVYHFSFLSPSLWETARYRLKGF